ncbi:unnamed protein product [Rhodiola kirilowii]
MMITTSTSGGDGFTHLLGSLEQQNHLFHTHQSSSNSRRAIVDFALHSNQEEAELIISRNRVFGSLLKIGDSIAEEGKADANELERYTDSEEGFTLLKPHSWNKVEKAGANVLFEEVNKGGPVRLAKLSDFGTPQFVASKLISAEKRKESTNDATLIDFRERKGQGGSEVYEFEYEVDSSRGGLKKIFSAAFVASKKLYLLNIAHSDKPEDPIDAHTRLMLEKVLHSFDLAP